MTYNSDWLCHLATFFTPSLKGGQVTKPIIVVKICYKLLYVIQVVKKIFDKHVYTYGRWYTHNITVDHYI